MRNEKVKKVSQTVDLKANPLKQDIQISFLTTLPPAILYLLKKIQITAAVGTFKVFQFGCGTLKFYRL